MACPTVQPVAPGPLYLSDVVPARSWCSTAAPGTAGALPCSDPGLCPHSCKITWMSLVSLPVCAGDRPGVAVSVCPGACGDGTCKAPGWEPAGSARPRLPRAASCAINDKAAAELCLCAGSLCVSRVCLCLPWLCAGL